MNKNLKIIFIVVVSLVVVLSIGALLVAFLTGERKDTENTNEVNNTTVTNATSTTNGTQENNNTSSILENDNTNVDSINTNGTTTTSDLEADLKAIVSIFSERFGSYSNQSNFENITNNLSYMSESMQKWANQYIEDQREAIQPGAEYNGTSTKALSITTVSLEESEGKAEFTVSAQRKESSGSAGETNIYYQDMTIKFVKENGAWKVNEARWQSVNE